MNNLDNRHSVSAVKSPYAASAKALESALCCPVEYNHDSALRTPESFSTRRA